MPITLTAADAGELIRRARKLLRRGLLTHRELVLFDTMLWSCRRPGSGDVIISYTSLQRLAHMARETIARGLRRLAQLGLLSIQKRRIRIGWASRQATSCYRLAPAPVTEFGSATVIQEMKISLDQDCDNARSHLARIAAERAKACAAAWLRGDRNKILSRVRDHL